MIKRNKKGQFIGVEIPTEVITMLGEKRDGEIAKIFKVHRYTVVQWRDKLNIKTPLKKWSYDYCKCRLCKTTKYKHRWKGYCKKCWTKSPEYKMERLNWYYNNKLTVKLQRKKYYKNNRDVILRKTSEYKIKHKIRCSDNYPAIYWVNRIKLIYDKKLPCKICDCKIINKFILLKIY